MKRIILLLGLTAAAGCGGGGGTSSSIPPSSLAIGATPTPAPAGNGTTAQTRVSITIPAPTALSSARRVRYVSSSTNSLTLTSSAGVTVINLGSSSPNCSTTSGVRNCVISVQLPQGANVPFTARTYASTDGTGATLSIATGTTTVVANQTNTLNLTLNAVVAGLRVALAPMPFTSGTAGTATVTTTVLDAAGQVIVVGPNALVDQNDNPVTVTLATSDTSGATHVSATTLGTAAVTLSYNGGTASSGAAVTATASNGSSAIASASAAIQFSVSPTPAPSGSVQNGSEQPTGFLPYASGCSSPLNCPVSNMTNPTLLANSDAIIAHLSSTGNNAGPSAHTQEWDAGYDAGPARFVATANDPLVHTECVQYCDSGNSALTIHIPAKMRPATNSDHHCMVIQPDGTEVDLWECHQTRANGDSSGQVDHDWTSSDTLFFNGGGACSNFYSGSGFNSAGYASTNGGSCLWAGIVAAEELSSGHINHALISGITCLAANTFVYPAYQNGDHACQGSGPDVPLGAHIWLDLSDSQIDSLSGATSSGKVVLHALHQYGLFIVDSECVNPSCPSQGSLNGLGISFEPDSTFAILGNASPMVAIAQKEGWTPVTIPARSQAGSTYVNATRYVLGDPWTPVDWHSHLHILDPCYAKGTC